VDVDGSVSLPSIASVKRARELTRSVNVLLVLRVVRDSFRVCSRARFRNVNDNRPAGVDLDRQI
jgi:hypothetical protein